MKQTNIYKKYISTIWFACVMIFFSQPILAQDITLQLKNVTVKEAIEALHKTKNYSVVIKSAEINMSKKVSVNATNAPIKAVLDQIFVGQNVSYAINGYSIIISKKSDTSQQNSSKRKKQTITGIVYDEEGNPVIGASVMNKETAQGAITDLDGKFSITVSEKKKVLVITYIGMKPQEVVSQPGKLLKVKMEDESQLLDEVVVVSVGYGNARKRDLTGAISSVGENTLKNIPVTSASSALTGRLAGVSVITSEGSPDASVSIRVRGGGSITQSNEPLFIVDGFEVSGIDDIPPTDIESIDVLKDASSTAIYGAKGANGVILVTTKSGRTGRTEVSFNASVGFSRMYNQTEVLSPYEYVYLQRELDSSDNAGFFDKFGRWEDINNYKARVGTNWQDMLFGNTGIKQNYNLNISGGSKDLIYSLSYTHDDESYIMSVSNFKRDNLNLKLTKKFGDKLRLDFNAKMTNRVVDGPSVSSGSKLRDAIKYPNIGTLTDLSDEDLAGDDEILIENISNLNDPMFNITNEYKKQTKFNNNYNVALIWNIIKGLEWRAEGTYGYSYDRTDNIWLANTGEANSKAGQPVARRQYWNGNNWALRTILNYKFDIQKKHRFGIMAGWEAKHSQRDKMEINADYYPADYTVDNILAMWNNGTSEPTYTTIEEPSRSMSYFGRLNYIFNDRYYLTFTLRSDGTNVFAPGNKWGIFPAGSLAWRISDEKFMDSVRNWFNNLKLRASYGKSGNARVGSYWRQTYSPVTNTKNLYYQNEIGQSSLQPSTRLRNENLTWESKYSTNLGLDMTFWNRLNVTFDFYNDVTKDLIMEIQLPSVSGYRTQYQNLGQTTNRGVELSLNANLINKKDFFLDFNFNIAFNKNRVDALYGSEDTEMIIKGDKVEVGSDNYRVFVGQEVGLMYGYVCDGMYTFDDFNFDETTQRWVLKEGVPDVTEELLTNSGQYFGPGHLKLKDLNGDGHLDADNDRQVIGHALPKHTGGFGISAGWKGFDLTALFNWSYGNDVFNANKIDYTSFVGSKRYQNMSSEMSLANRFATIDPETGYNIYYGAHADPVRLQELNANATIWHPLMNNSIMTDWAIEDGSFLRLGTLTLGYTFPQNLTRKFGVRNLRLYATGSNLLCITGYSGQDPEVNTSSNKMVMGFDYSAYPKSRSYIVGVNVTF